MLVVLATDSAEIKQTVAVVLVHAVVKHGTAWNEAVGLMSIVAKPIPITLSDDMALGGTFEGATCDKTLASNENRPVVSEAMPVETTVIRMLSASPVPPGVLHRTAVDVVHEVVEQNDAPMRTVCVRS
jgi:hypothetical protein